MKEKIEEILDMLFIEETKYKVNVAQSSTVSNTVPDIRSSPEYSAVNIVGKEAVVKLLYTLIQEERKEAVKGFVEYLKLERKIFYAEPTLFALLEKASAEYLSSIGKEER